MFKLLSQLLGAVAGAFALALFITLNVYLTPFLGAWMFLVDAVLLLGTLVFVSFMADTSIPLIRTVLRRSYYRVKFKKGKKRKLSNTQMFFLKTLAFLIVLFKSAEDGFKIIEDEAHIIHGKAILFLDKEKKKGKEVFTQLQVIHRDKQRRAATVSAFAVALFVVGSVLTALFSSLMYSNIFQSQAATYTWTQNDWSGGTSTAIAVHPGDQSLWDNYASADSNIVIDGSGNITMSSGVQDVEETTTADFSNGTVVEGVYMLDSRNDELKMSFGYDASSICGNFEVHYKDSGPYTNFPGPNVITGCANLCSNCRAPTQVEFLCICQNQPTFGNLTDTYYWVADGNLWIRGNAA
ncbi:hypothetical protein K8R62_01455, partial [bacterium]|nr:hypothetical protein [bacterium]